MTAEEAPDVEHVDKSQGGEPTGLAGMKRIVRVRISTLVWTALVVASMLTLAGLLYFQYRPDRQTDDAAAQAAVAAAKDGTAAVYTYSADTLDRDISSAKSYLTGDFLSEYQQYAQSPATAATKQNAVKTTATVAGAAPVEVHPGTAEVLVFVNQSTTSAQSPGPMQASRSVLVTLLKVDGKWLISSLKPV